jgi:hypothetical protein
MATARKKEKKDKHAALAASTKQTLSNLFFLSISMVVNVSFNFQTFKGHVL